MSPSSTVSILTRAVPTRSKASTATVAEDSRVLHRDLNKIPHTIVAASRINFTLSDGKRVLDASGGAAVSCIGHGCTQVTEAIKSQLEVLDYCPSMFFSCPSLENLCKTLVDGTNGQMAKAYIACSGSEAMEAAMKLARQYYMELPSPQLHRVRFIARRQSYHGTTLATLGLGGHEARRHIYEPMLSDLISHVSPCNEYRDKIEGESSDAYVRRLALELDNEFQRVGPETVCAFVAETVVGTAMGCIPAVRGYFQAIKTVCDKYGALLVLDEVMCGMGRTGTTHAWQQEGVVPDIQAIGKSLGGGYAPIAGLIIGHRVNEVMRTGSGKFSHGHTYQGHPVSCSAALEVQNIIRQKDLVNNVRDMGVYLGQTLREKLGNHPHVGNIRGKGLFWGIEFVKDKETKEPFARQLDAGTLIYNMGIKQNDAILVYPGSGTADGISGDHILIAPPFDITSHEIEDLVNRVVTAITSVFNLIGRQFVETL